MGVMKLDDSVISININRDGHTRCIERKLGSIAPVILVLYMAAAEDVIRESKYCKDRSICSDIGILLFFLDCLKLCSKYRNYIISVVVMVMPSQ